MAIGLYIIIGIFVVVPVVLVTLFLIGRRGRGRLIECPECGAQFPRPSTAEKTVGLGPVPALPGVGNYTCPKCKYRDRTSNFNYIEENKSNPSEKKL